MRWPVLPLSTWHMCWWHYPSYFSSSQQSGPVLTSVLARSCSIKAWAPHETCRVWVKETDILHIATNFRWNNVPVCFDITHPNNRLLCRFRNCSEKIPGAIWENAVFADYLTIFDQSAWHFRFLKYFSPFPSPIFFSSENSLRINNL